MSKHGESDAVSSPLKDKDNKDIIKIILSGAQQDNRTHVPPGRAPECDFRKGILMIILIIKTRPRPRSGGYSRAQPHSPGASSSLMVSRAALSCSCKVRHRPSIAVLPLVTVSSCAALLAFCNQRCGQASWGTRGGACWTDSCGESLGWQNGPVGG